MKRYQPSHDAAQPASPIRLDMNQCIQDDKGNVFCPIIQEPAPMVVPAPAPAAPMVVAAPAPAPMFIAAPAPAAPAPAAPMVVQYASDDNLPWPPPGMTDANCGCIIVKPEQQTALALTRPRSLTNLTQAEPRIIDHGAINALPQGGAYGNGGFYGDSSRTLVFATPTRTHISHPHMAQINSGSMPPGAMAYPPPKSGLAMDSRYPQKSVNMRRAIGFAVVMSCLCPPIGLIGLCTALRGRHNNHRGHKERAGRYRRASYAFSVMAVILVILGIVIIVLMTQRYSYL